MTPLRTAVAGGVATLTIDRRDRRNAINPAVVRALGEALAQVEADASVRAVVLTGAGDEAFCAGGDLAGTEADTNVGRHVERSELAKLFAQMRASRLPIVARVNGHALAGGFGLMLACDLVVAVDDAELGLPEIDVGLWPFMVTAIVRRDIPRKLALELMLTGRRIPVSDGMRWGFVNAAVPRAELDAAVARLTGTLASKSPLVIALGKSSFYRAEDMAFEAQLDYLAGMLTLCLESEDTVEGITAFLQKRAPEWKGR